MFIDSFMTDAHLFTRFIEGKTICFIELKERQFFNSIEGVRIGFIFDEARNGVDGMILSELSDGHLIPLRGEEEGDNMKRDQLLFKVIMSFADDEF